MAHRLPKRALVALTFTTAIAAPVTITEDGLGLAVACADGTCCYEAGSECIINNILKPDAYRKAGAGACGGGPDKPAPDP